MSACNMTPVSSLLRPSPQEWWETLLKTRMGYEHPEHWQVKLSMAKYEGKEVFVVVPTGSGKTTITIAPLIAAKEKKERKVGMVIVPTKALAENHVSSSQTLSGPLN
jgi:ATP-dependent helicase YprA (DUF1998 family)